MWVGSAHEWNGVWNGPYFILLLISNFRGSKNRGSMDPVHDRGSMNPVHERGPLTRSIFSWTRSMDPVHGGGSMFCTFPSEIE